MWASPLWLDTQSQRSKHSTRVKRSCGIFPAQGEDPPGRKDMLIDIATEKLSQAECTTCTARLPSERVILRSAHGSSVVGSIGNAVAFALQAKFR
jgi:hypothetical protein